MKTCDQCDKEIKPEDAHIHGAEYYGYDENNPLCVDCWLDMIESLDD